MVYIYSIYIIFIFVLVSKQLEVSFCIIIII